MNDFGVIAEGRARLFVDALFNEAFKKYFGPIDKNWHLTSIGLPKSQHHEGFMGFYRIDNIA